jgi:hypothetical protein
MLNVVIRKHEITSSGIALRLQENDHVLGFLLQLVPNSLYSLSSGKGPEKFVTSLTLGGGNRSFKSAIEHMGIGRATDFKCCPISEFRFVRLFALRPLLAYCASLG